MRYTDWGVISPISTNAPSWESIIPAGGMAGYVILLSFAILVLELAETLAGQQNRQTIILLDRAITWPSLWLFTSRLIETHNA